MAKDKSPAFQFYPDAWLSSKDITLMTPAEEGAFIRLLAIAWLEADCGLPSDDNSLAILSRLGPQWKRDSGKKVRAKFELINGRLFNSRLLDEREKQKEWQRKSSIGGKTSATKRAANVNQTSTTVGNNSNHLSTKPQPPLENGCGLVDDFEQPNVNSSSSSSSSSSTTIKPTTKNTPPTPSQTPPISLVQNGASVHKPPSMELSTQRENPTPSLEQFEEFMGRFLALGRGSRAKEDMDRCKGYWGMLRVEERIAAFRFVTANFEEWKTRPTGKIPQPWNFLEGKQWKRSVPRLIPQQREKSKGEISHDRAAQMFMKGGE